MVKSMARDPHKDRKALEKIVTARQLKNKTHITELVEQIVYQFGGPAVMAKIFVQEYNAADSGTLVRGRMLEFLMRLILQLNQVDDGLSDLSKYSDDELKSIVKDLMVLEEAEESSLLQNQGESDG